MTPLLCHSATLPKIDNCLLITDNYAFIWRGAGVDDRGALEKHCGREVTVGSNPTLSAREGRQQTGVLFFMDRSGEVPADKRGCFLPGCDFHQAIVH